MSFWSTARIALVIALPLSTSGCLTAGADLEVIAGALRMDIEGDAGVEGTQVDIENDLDLGDTDTVPYAKVRGGLFGLNAWASGFQTSQDGNSRLSADFGDIDLGVNVSTDLELATYQAGLSYSILDVAGFSLSPGVGVDLFDIDLVVEAAGFETEALNETQPVPLLFLEAGWDTPVLPLQLRASAGGIKGDYGDIDGTVLDIEALILWEVYSKLNVYAGYRRITFDVEDDDPDDGFIGDFDLSGFMVGGGLRF